MKKLYLMVVALMFLISLNYVFSALTVTIEEAAACNDVNTIFKMDYLSNAHGSLYNIANDYAYKVCCIGMEGNTCEADDSNIVMRLSAEDNAHAQQASIGTYPEKVCFGNVECNYTTTTQSCTDLDPSYICIASMNATDNTHLGDCDAYSIKICCKEGCIETGYGICAVDDECCDYDDAWCALYTGEGKSTSGHCCDDTYVWDSIDKICIESGVRQCYGKVDSKCAYAPPNEYEEIPDPDDYWADDYCITEGTSGRACCEIGSKYGVGPPYYDYTNSSFESNIVVYGAAPVAPAAAKLPKGTG